MALATMWKSLVTEAARLGRTVEAAIGRVADNGMLGGGVVKGRVAE